MCKIWIKRQITHYDYLFFFSLFHLLIHSTDYFFRSKFMTTLSRFQLRTRRKNNSEMKSNNFGMTQFNSIIICFPFFFIHFLSLSFFFFILISNWKPQKLLFSLCHIDKVGCTDSNRRNERASIRYHHCCSRCHCHCRRHRCVLTIQDVNKWIWNFEINTSNSTVKMQTIVSQTHAHWIYRKAYKNERYE